MAMRELVRSAGFNIAMMLVGSGVMAIAIGTYHHWLFAAGFYVWVSGFWHLIKDAL